MDSLVFISTISGSFTACVALTFLYAAWGKLRSPGSVAAGMESLGVPAILRLRVFATGLPFLEIVIALGLLLAPAHWFVAFAGAALALTTAFLITVWRAAARDETARCNCFGSEETAVGWWTVARNAVLMLMSGAALLTAATSPGLLWRENLAAVLLGVVALAAAALGALAISRERRADEDAADTDGTVEGAVEHSSMLGLRNLDLQLASLPAIAGGTPIVLVFTKQRCHACIVASAAVKTWVSQTPALTARLVLDATPSEALDAHPDFADHTLLDSGKMAARLMKVGGYPTAFLIGRDGAFATEAIEGSDAIIEFLAVLTDSLAAAPPTDR